jgi:hypothetical protein
MAKNNDVFSIIPIPLDDTNILGVGQEVATLTAGQLGVFDYDTGLSINAAGATAVKNFFIALALDTTGDGSVDEIVKSAGTHVQKKNVTATNLKCYSAGVEQVIDIVNFTADCDKQYGLKIEINNDEKYMNYGFNQLTKTFIVKTSCCEGCESCGTGNCAELVKLLIADINNDEDGIVVASAFVNIGAVNAITVPTAPGTATVTIGTDVIPVAILGTETAAETSVKIAAAINASSKYVSASDGINKVSVVLKDGSNLATPIAVTFAAGATGITATTLPITLTEITDIDLFATSNPEACLSLRLTSVTQAVKQFCNVNTQYYKQRMPVLTASFVSTLGFECTGEIKETVAPAFEEGSGYDLAQIEYQVGGFVGKPGIYRTGDLIGVAFNNFSSIINKTTKYQKVDITYDLESNSGWMDYKNNLNTTLAFPCGDTGAVAVLTPILDALLGTDLATDLGDCAGCP